MKNKKGFTLLETIAIIVILSIIALIAVPIVSDHIDETKKNALKDSIISMIDAIKIYRAENDYPEYPSEGYNVLNLEYEHKNNIQSGYIKYINGEYVIENIYDGIYCVNGPIDDLEFSEDECE